MKAVRIHEHGGPEVLVYEDVPDPEPGPGQVLVRVEAASVNPIDVAVRENRFPTPKQPPKILGSDGAGTVVAVGEGVTAVAPGQRVLFSGLGIGSEGSYAEYAVIQESQAVVIPDSLPAAEAAAIGMAFPTAYYALVTRGQLQAGETVLVQGASGGVGTASVQLARALGARVFGTAAGDEALALVRDLGAEAAIDYRHEDVPARVRELTGGKGVDLIHELLASVNLPADVAMLAKRGRVVCTGQGPEPEARLPIGPALAGDLDVRFMSLANAGRAGVAAIAREIVAMVTEGRLRPVVGARLPLAEARRAHELLEGDHLGKIVLEP